MNDQEKSHKLEKILSDATLVKRLYNAADKADMQAIFSEFGLELTSDEVDAFIRMMNAATTGDEEISEEQLEEVTGGVAAVWILETAFKIIFKIAKPIWKAGKWLANQGY